MTDIAERLLNPGVVLTMFASGVAYGFWFLWAVNIRDTVRLWSASVVPGIIFLSIITAVRFVQGTAATVYIYLMVDWIIFSNAAFVSVLARRWWTRRSHLRQATKEGKE